jgi:putative NADH-flavin reductase
MKKVIVFGATGGTGKLVVAQALAAGHKVTVVVRTPEAFDLTHQNLDIIKGDVFQPSTFDTAIAGKDVVVSCLGTQKREPTTVYSDGVRNISKAMEKSGVKRLICLSAGAVIVPPKSNILMKFVIKNILQRVFKHLYSDMLVMEKMLETSPLNWTVIRVPRLKDSKHTGHYRMAINEHLNSPSSISRADLADYIVTHLTDEKAFKSLVEVSY